MTKQEVLAAMTAKQAQVKTICKEIKALRIQLENMEAAEKAEETKKEQERKQQKDLQEKKLDNQQSVEALLNAQIEAQKLADLQRQLIIQADREETQRIINKLNNRTMLEGGLKYEKKMVRGKKVETYECTNPEGGNLTLIVKWDKIEEYYYGDKLCTYKKVGNYWHRSYGNAKYKNVKELIACHQQNRSICSTLPEPTQKTVKNK